AADRRNPGLAPPFSSVSICPICVPLCQESLPGGAAMDLTIQILLAVSLAACCGLRAFLPLLVTGVLARTHHIPLNPHLAFLARTDVLVIFGIAAVVEIVADKFIVVDHALDAAATFLRPAAGTVLACSVLTRMDP